MRRVFVVTFAVGFILAVFGLIWALQGFGVWGGSPMSNTTTWSISGPITVVIGIVIALFSWRKLSSTASTPSGDPGEDPGHLEVFNERDAE